MNINQIVSALQSRVQEYCLIRNVNTGDSIADAAYNQAVDMAISDMNELIADIGHSVNNNIAVVRHLHAVN